MRKSPDLPIPNFVAWRDDFVFRCDRKVVSFRGSFPRNPVGGRTFELDRRDSFSGLRAQARAAEPKATNGNPGSAFGRDATELCESLLRTTRSIKRHSPWSRHSRF